MKDKEDARITYAMKRTWFVISAVILLFWAMVMSALRYSVSSALGEWYVGRAYILRMNDVIYAENDVDIDGVSLQEEMLEDGIFRKISAVYMDSAAESIAFDTLFKEPDITKEEVQLLYRTVEKLNACDMTVDEEGLMESIDYGTEAMNTYISGITSGVHSSFIKVAALLYLYTVRPVFAGILAIASILLFVLYAKHSPLSHTAYALLITGILVILSGFVVSGLSLSLTNAILGRSVSVSNMPFVVSGFLLIVLSLCMLVYNQKQKHAL